MSQGIGSRLWWRFVAVCRLWWRFVAVCSHLFHEQKHQVVKRCRRPLDLHLELDLVW